jgi:flagellar hook-length control protein FliK
MPSFDPPINPIALTTSIGPAASAPATGDVKTAASQDFVAMLADLLSAGAEVVAAPVGASEQLDTEVAMEADELIEGVIDPSLAAAMLLQGAAAKAVASPDAEPAALLPSSQTEEGTAILSSQRFSEAKQEAITQGDMLEVATKVLPDPGKTQGAANDRDFAAELLAVDKDMRTANANANALTSPSGNEGVRHTAEVQARVGTPAWADQVATRVSFIHDRGMQSASLKLSPEHLGPLEIQITVKDDQASVWFGAAHAETRTALEQALPRLRELLQSQGLALADAGVFREPPREHARAYRQQNDAFGKTPNDERVISVTAGRTSLIDAYA